MLVGLSDQVRLADHLTAEKYGVGGIELMKNAATAVYNAIRSECKGKNVCILCGKGNNAGDGFALANLLLGEANQVTVSLLCGENFSPDAKYYFDRLSPDVAVTAGCFCCGDVYVDAVFGTGFFGELPADVAEIFRLVNQSTAYKVAVDLPSGVCSDNGAVSLDSFEADITVTFQILKVAHILPQSKKYCGEIIVSDIGLSDLAIKEAGIELELLEGSSLPVKDPTAHKGNNGTLFSIVGCKQYQGAATLSLLASLRSGCGLVFGFIPESIYPTVSSKINSAVLLPCAENGAGKWSSEFLNKLDELIAKRHPTAILAGSGMNLSDHVRDTVQYVLQQNVPCVIDGDGLRYASATLLAERNSPTILTPHLGEFSRMCGVSVSEIANDRLAIAREFAVQCGVVLILKDYITVITNPKGKQWLLCNPNAGLAKGGSGDVLAGMIASFLAQGFSDEDAAKAGVWFHSLAGKKATQVKGVYAMLPEDLIEVFPEILI